MLILLIICALIACNQNGVDCGRERLRPRILGGEPTNIDHLWWQAALLNNKKFLCGGTIVAPKKIVTAAHCTENVREFYKTQLKVRVGSSDYDNGGVLSGVSNLYQHPEYNIPTSTNNDIAVIILEETLEFGPTIGGILLASEALTLPSGTWVTVSGYGAISETEQKPNRLHSVAMPIMIQAICEKAYKKYKGDAKITNKMFCAGFYGSGKLDACTGDSGGPLVYNAAGPTPMLYGVVSWGNGCGDPDFPGIYTKVAAYRDWINNCN